MRTPSGATRCSQLQLSSVRMLGALAAPKAPRWRLALVLLAVGLPVAAALPSASDAPHEAAVDAGRETDFDAPPPLVNASISSHVTRRLTQISVQPGFGTLQAAIDAANDGDELVLANGTYTGSTYTGNQVLEIRKSITIRAQHPRGAVLDGQNARRVVSITSGTVVLEGLDITRGRAVRASAPRAPSW